MAFVELEEQQEKLRRVVDEWRCRSHDLLKNLQKEPYESSPVFDACTSNSDPIRVFAVPLDHADLLTLIESDNVAVTKFVTVLSHNCIEISRLSRYARRNIYRQLLLFGHGSSLEETLLEGEPQKAFGHSLSLFMEVYEITCRMNAVTCNLLQQLDFIYSFQDKSGTPCKSFGNVTLATAFSSFADGLSMFLILDEILAQNGRIKTYLSHFKRMLNKVKPEVDNFGIGVGDQDCLDQVVSHLEKLLDVGLFQRLLQESSWVDTLQKAKRNKKFLDACTSCIHDGLSEILPRLDTWKESLLDRRKILHYVALFLFGTHASAEAPEKRLGKVIMEMLQVVPVIYFKVGFRVMLLDLLRSHFPQSVSSWSTLRDASREFDAVKSNYLKHLNEMYSRDWQTMKDSLACWVASFQSTIHPMTELSRVEVCLRLHFKQIVQGILVARRLQMMVDSILDLHALLEVPIKRERLKSLCHVIVLLKVIENNFHKKELDIIQSFPHIINIIQSDVEQSLLLAKDKLESEVTKGSQVSKIRFFSSLTSGGKDVDTRLSDSLSLVLLSLQMLRGGGSSKRLLILSIALDVVQSIGHLDINYSKIMKLISKVDIVADFQSLVEEVTDCSFLYWRKEMMGTWLSMIYKDIHKFTWLQYLLDAFCDGLWLLKLGHVGKFTIQSHEEEIENALKNEIIAPLCRDIETDLRLHVHSTHLKGSVHVNPRKTGVRDLSWYLQLKPLQLPFKCIDIKLEVDHYLNSAFYSHSVMSSYDWKIYSEMRQLAELKYGLVDDIHFPERCLDYSVDVTEIVQNLTKFSTNYSYNISNQVFIEKIASCQGRKTLRVFGVEHVSSTMTTHGLGTISTTLDSVHKFVSQKIAALSELLQNYFASFHSVKEFKFWKIDQGAINNYPWVQVEDHNLVMGKLPFGDHELRFLESLFSIITEMGNVLGLARILQAGVSRHTCGISRFICRPTGVKSFAENSKKLGFADGTVTAGKTMDAAIETKYQAEGHMDCFFSLLTAFSKELESGESILLRDLFLTIPALIIKLVDSKINCKGNLLRRSSDMGNQVTTDGGFMLGVAFILRVTGQDKSFDGLHWFAGMIKQLEEVLRSLGESRDTEQRKGSAGLSGLKLWGGQTSPISTETQKGIDKVKKYQKELELINCGLNVARTIML